MNRNQLAAIQALRGLAGPATRHPVVKLAIKYWWMSVPVGIALYGKYKARVAEEKTYKLYNAFDDFGTVMGPVMTFIGLSELASRMEKRGDLDGSPIRDAEYQRVEVQTDDTQPIPQEQAV